VLCGPAGCGKSTFAAKQFRPTQIVSSDECRALVSDDPANQGVSHHAFDLMHFIIKKRLMLGRLTVCDATNLRRESRRALVEMAHAAQFNSAAILFDLRRETCLARNAARARVVPEEALEKQFKMLEETKRAIKKEGFDLLFFLQEEDQDAAAVKVGPAFRRDALKRDYEPPQP
jgi:protein phosphatase